MNSGSNKTYVRKPAFAGAMGFYPSDPVQLTEVIRGYLDDAEKTGDSPPWGLIAPHAGYVYSGPVAGWAYRQIEGERFDHVIVMAPSHRESLNFAAVLPDGVYRTPLGDIPVDSELAALIAGAGRDGVRLAQTGHSGGDSSLAEHSLEVQLPFLQVAIGEFSLVPIVIGQVSWKICQDLGNAIAEAVDIGNVLVVASSDLSHYHGYDEALHIDENFIDYLRRGDPRTIIESCKTGVLEACGALPIAVLMHVSQLFAAANLKILRHATSGDVIAGEKDQVVGYLAAAYYQNSTAVEENASDRVEEAEDLSTPALTGADKTFLLSKARHAIALELDARDDSRNAAINDESESLFDKTSPRLDEPRGIFVTIRLEQALRGCIGQLYPSEPLRDLTVAVARQSAFEDPRFPPLNRDEFDRIHLEISVLSPLSTIKDMNKIEPGLHGLLIKCGHRQGLLLPQVAKEYGWNRVEFLEATCRKAGLPTNAWADSNAELHVFTADIFEEQRA